MSVMSNWQNTKVDRSTPLLNVAIKNKERLARGSSPKTNTTSKLIQYKTNITQNDPQKHFAKILRSKKKQTRKTVHVARTGLKTTIAERSMLLKVNVTTRIALR
jgi:hypothetical protein